MSPSSPESGHGSEQLGGGAGGVEATEQSCSWTLALISRPMHKEKPEEHEKKSGELFQV